MTARRAAGFVESVALKDLARCLLALIGRRKHLGDINTQRGCHAFNVVDGDVPLAPLHLSDVGAMQAACFGKSLLRQAKRKTLLAYRGS